MKIPFQKLSPAALRGLIEEFILREGTDYGEHELSLEEKVANVRRLLKQGDAFVVFDHDTETCSIVTK